jgi:hypothetical protein
MPRVFDPSPPARPLADPVYGDLALLEEMRAGGVKGNLLTSRIWYVREQFGPDALAAVAAAVGPAARARLDNPPMPFVWCTFGEMMEIDRAILEGPMHGDLGRMKHFGGEIAKHDLPTIYKVLFKVGTPRFLMKRVATVASTYLRDAPMRGVDLPDGRVRVLQAGKIFPYYFCSYGVCGWFEAAMELSGGKNIQALHTSCRHRGDAACGWDVRFE